MDRILRRELDAIARDNHSGAAELALRATRALRKWLRQNRPMEPDFLDAARAVVKAQRSMAPFWRLANEIACAVESANPKRALASRLANFERVLLVAPRSTASKLRSALPKRPRMALVATYSYSSTVVRALVAGRSRIRHVYCAESRPGNEGQRLARALSHSGIRVMYRTDAAFLAMPVLWNYVVVGADGILADGFWNKIGTEVLLQRTREARHRRRLRIVVVSDTTKFWKETPLWMAKLRALAKYGPPTQLWRNPPHHVSRFNEFLSFSRFTADMRVLTERGWMTPKQVRKELSKIRISPRLKELID